jgi:hypothetical protein
MFFLSVTDRKDTAAPFEKQGLYEEVAFYSYSLWAQRWWAQSGAGASVYVRALFVDAGPFELREFRCNRAPHRRGSASEGANPSGHMGLIGEAGFGGDRRETVGTLRDSKPGDACA